MYKGNVKYERKEEQIETSKAKKIIIVNQVRFIN